MKGLIHFCAIAFLLFFASSCSDVSFNSSKNGSSGGGGNTPTACVGTSCPPSYTYTWYQGGFNGACSKPCGGGEETQTVECRRSDDVVVADTFCANSGPRPNSVRSCNVQACVSFYTWNVGGWGACSLNCGGGVRTRSVFCQDQNGTTVSDTNCNAAAKPAASEACNTSACPPVWTYAWQVTPGVCSVTCGGGTVTDTVVCKRNDNLTVADSNCDAGTKPPVTHSCNTDPCAYTYQWEPGSWTVCSKTCGPGTQTRSMACRRNDGAYVPDNYCTGAKPAVSQSCNLGSCPTTKTVTQVETVTPALNSVDVILVVDDSSSMAADQAKLAQRMAGFLGDLDAANIDYQVCLTTTDVSYYKGSPVKWSGLNSYIITKNTPNKNTVFTNTLHDIGAEWSSDEQGIKALGLMIKDYRAAGCLRDKATLTTILISDENERSVGGNQSWTQYQYQPLEAMNYPDTLISQVHTVFDSNGFVKPFVWNSIIVKPNDLACRNSQDAQGTPSFYGTLYAELSTKTGGFIGSICDSDYTSNLKLIKDRVVNSMPGLTLQCTPIGNPQVSFDRIVNTTVSLTGNTLKFMPAIPEGTKVTVVYTCPN